MISFFLGCGQINSKYKDSEIFPPLSAEKNLYFLMFLVHSNSFDNLSKKSQLPKGPIIWNTPNSFPFSIRSASGLNIRSKDSKIVSKITLHKEKIATLKH